jgi:ribulose-phosphate 3-epimerase
VAVQRIDDAIDEILAESFPASDPPPWTTGVSTRIERTPGGRAGHEASGSNRAVSARRLEIAPSILSADFLQLGAQVSDALEAGVRRIHVDVMDGHFVPNLSMGPLVVAALRPLAERAAAVLEVHLMIAEPDRYLGAFSEAGATAMTVHVETCPHLHRTVAAIRGLAAQPGVAINPATPVAALEEILPDIEVALVMSVDPGFGGQSFIPGTIGKVSRLRAELVRRGLDHVEIEVDGGVGAENIRELADAGMTIAVAGTSVFDAGAPVATNIRLLRAACGLGDRS